MFQNFRAGKKKKCSAVRRSALILYEEQTIVLLSLWSEHQSENNLSITVLSELPHFVYLTPPRAKIISEKKNLIITAVLPSGFIVSLLALPSFSWDMWITVQVKWKSSFCEGENLLPWQLWWCLECAGMLQQVAGLSQSGKPHPPSACEDENTQRRALVRRKGASSKYECIKIRLHVQIYTSFQ